MSYSPSNRVSSFQSNFACTISPVTASSRSAPQLVRVPVRLCVRMTIRLNGSLQLSLRLCVYHLASHRIFTFRSAACPRPSPRMRAYNLWYTRVCIPRTPSRRSPSLAGSHCFNQPLHVSCLHVNDTTRFDLSARVTLVQ